MRTILYSLLRYSLVIMLLIPISPDSLAQKKQKTVAGLKSEQEQVKKDIANQKKKLSSNEKDVEQRLKTLMVLNGQIETKKNNIDSIKDGIKRLDKEMESLSRDISSLKEEIEDRKAKYVRSVRYMHKNRSIQSQLMFIFSADNFSQMYRRMRFMREYATYQRSQGEALKAKQAELESKKGQLATARWRQSRLLEKGEKEKKDLEGKQKEQQKTVASLKKQQKTIQGIIAKQQKRNQELDKEIDRLIALEIEKSKKGNSSPDAKEPDIKLSGSFESNKGKLPMPVAGSYTIINHFGQYDVDGLKGVRLDSKGINIQGSPGAKVRSIFDGEVSAVFTMGGVTGVMVRHGSYISVYCNLSSVSVKKGQKVSTKQTLGTIGKDRILQFQLRKEKSKLNPEAWLAR